MYSFLTIITLYPEPMLCNLEFRADKGCKVQPKSRRANAIELRP